MNDAHGMGNAGKRREADSGAQYDKAAAAAEEERNQFQLREMDRDGSLARQYGPPSPASPGRPILVTQFYQSRRAKLKAWLDGKRDLNGWELTLVSMICFLAGIAVGLTAQ